MFVSVSLSAQPPIDTTTFYEGTIGWGPGRADPQRVYDYGSGQLVFNSYETLIAWDHELYYTFQPQLATNVPNRENETKTITGAIIDYGATFSDGSISKGFTDLNSAGANAGFSVGDVLYLMDAGGKHRAWFAESVVGTYTLTLRRYWYMFHIRTSPVINFINTSGIALDTFDIDDAEFTFERGLVQDTGPQWMFYTAMFGCFNSAAWNSNDTSRMNAIDQAHLIDDAVEKSGNDLTLNLGMPFPDNAFKQCMSNTWSSIGSKEWFLTKLGVGYGYNGDLYTLDSLGYPAWHNSSNVWHKSRSPIDRTGFLTWAGTGPYYVSVFDQPNLKIDLLRNDGYWGGWPASGRNGSIAVYEIQYIADWNVRKTAFLSGDIDTCAVPRDYMFELLQAPNKDADPILVGGKPVIKTIKNISPSLSFDAVHFTFTINSTSTFIGTGSFPNGIPLNFFNNTHVRKAFAYSFNQTQYIAQRCFGEAYRQYTPLIAGLYPDYRTVTSGYDVNYALAESELKQAMFGGLSVWNRGFTLTLATNAGSVQDIIREFFTKLSTYDGRTGPPFTINIAYVSWPEYLNYWENYELPIWSIGWLADFADADNFMRPYMHSNGDYSGSQNYTLPNGWGSTHGSNYPALNKDELIDKAFVTPDESDRAKMYADLESIYVADCPSLPLPASTGRRWCQYWVKGWYYDALYPAFYIRDYFKMDDCWYDMTGPTVAVSDGMVNMRDIQYLIIHFNAKPPVPGKPDPNWVGTYGNGGVDPSGDRLSNMRDIQGAVLHFNHKLNTLTP